MVIKSNFKDYYDFVAKMYGGGDPRLVYVRRRITPLPGIAKDVEVEGFRMRAPRENAQYRSENYSSPEKENLYLVIAGKAFLLERKTQEYAFSFRTDYDLDSFKVVSNEDANDVKKLHRWYGSRELFQFGKEYDFLIDLSRSVGSPVFIIAEIKPATINSSTVTVIGQCPILGRLGVQSFINPQQLYQELAMFMGNKMKAVPDTQPPVELGNRQKILKAGFDLVHSFRHRV